MPLPRRPVIPKGQRFLEIDMEATQIWVRHWITGATMIALPLAVMAHGPTGNLPENCPPIPRAGSPMASPPFGMLPGGPPLDMMPPFMRGVKLTDEQYDKMFALMHEQIPIVREKLKAASKAREELHRMAGADHFDADKARALAETNAQAMAQVMLKHAELDAKLRMLLTPEQRKQSDDARSETEPCRSFRR